MSLLLVVIASTRPNRAGLPVARWFERRAREHGAFDLDVADLAELRLPLLDEPNHPRLRRYEHDHTRQWSERVDRADAVVLVMPEYNHSFTAPLKNAIDYLSAEWAGKPVGLVSYGGLAGGARAVVALEPVLLAVGLEPAGAVHIPWVSSLLDEERTTFSPTEPVERGARALLDRLAA